MPSPQHRVIFKGYVYEVHYFIFICTRLKQTNFSQCNLVSKLHARLSAHVWRLEVLGEIQTDSFGNLGLLMRSRYSKKYHYDDDDTVYVWEAFRKSNKDQPKYYSCIDF